MRWVDDKVDGAHSYRLVAHNTKTYHATELLKYVLRIAAQNGGDYIMHVDVTRAHLYASASRGTFVKLTAEDMKTGEEQVRQAHEGHLWDH